MFRSSYFQISPAPGDSNSYAEQDVSIATDVYDEFSCALLRSSTVECHYGLFDKDSNRCSLLKIKPNLNRPDIEEADSGKTILEKVGNDVSSVVSDRF